MWFDTTLLIKIAVSLENDGVQQGVQGGRKIVNIHEASFPIVGRSSRALNVTVVTAASSQNTIYRMFHEISKQLCGANFRRGFMKFKIDSFEADFIS